MEKSQNGLKNLTSVNSTYIISKYNEWISEKIDNMFIFYFMNKEEYERYKFCSFEFIIEDCNLPIYKHFLLLQDLCNPKCNLKKIIEKHNL